MTVAKPTMRELLEMVDADVRHHLRSDVVAVALIRPDAIRAVRAALQAYREATNDKS